MSKWVGPYRTVDRDGAGEDRPTNASSRRALSENRFLFGAVCRPSHLQWKEMVEDRAGVPVAQQCDPGDSHRLESIDDWSDLGQQLGVLRRATGATRDWRSGAFDQVGPDDAQGCGSGALGRAFSDRSRAPMARSVFGRATSTGSLTISFSIALRPSISSRSRKRSQARGPWKRQRHLRRLPQRLTAFQRHVLEPCVPVTSRRWHGSWVFSEA
ncbi:hypothetical protein SAMN05428953_12146 [Mesorhizobium muleiense]|uniref:Uncharacterized protein n=1 Tax=Mesorhizobium muleiense TaxID=1004279 RepID=A0A1G9F1A2_9HYPH|nr:hypothetical protein SAMN05428953_12146 [Mesorhizobium muleiense]